MRSTIGVLCLLLASVGLAQDKPLSQAELAKLPPYERLLKGDDAKEAAELEQSYNKALRAEDWAEAKKQAQALIEFRTQKQGQDHYEVTDAQQLLKYVEIRAKLTPEERKELADADQKEQQLLQLYQQGQFARATQLGERILATRKKLLGENHQSYAAGLNNLALLCWSMGDYTRAEPLYLKASDIEKKVLSENHPSYAASLSNLAGLYWSMGDHARAEQLYLKASDIEKRVLSENHPEYATSLNNLALLYHSMGDYARAEPLYLQARDIEKRVLSENHPESATSLNNLALLYHSMGEYAKAELLMVQARDLRRKVLGENHPEYATSLNNLASVYQSMGEYAHAEPLLLQTRDLRKKLLSENHPDYASSLNNLAVLYESIGEYSQAEPLLLQTRELTKKLLGENHPAYARSLNNLAALYLSMREYTKADPLMVQARDLRKKLLGENHPDYATSLNNLALLYMARAEYGKAELLMMQARDLRRKLLGENHPSYATNLKNLATLYQAMGEYSQAEPLYVECTRSYEMSRIARAGGFGRAIGGESQNPYFFLASVSARLNKPQQGFAMLERNLARALLDVQAERRGQQMTPDQQARRTQIVNDLSPLDKRIGVLVTRPKLTEDETKELSEKIAARSKLNVQLADLAAELSTQEVSDFASIQKAIPAGHALLTWVDVVGGRGKGETQEHWACIVKSTGDPIWVKLPGFGPSQEQAIADNRLTQELRKKLSTISDNPDEVNQLFEKVKAQRITPVLPHLEGIHTIYAICVNQMAGIPIEPMLPDRTISYIPSGTYLARRGKPLDKPNTILAVGDPAFPKQQEGTSWAELPGTNLEINELRKLFTSAGSQFLTRSQASEQQVDALRQSGELSKFKYLHFATHGKTNPLHAFESKIILSQDQPRGEIKAGEPWLNNEISAREVLDYWKLNCELVTLSACETALGISGNGDGLLGFAQSFLLSGSRSVCVSLWKVDDLATMLLMDRFYRNLLEKQQPKAVALHEAKTWLRNLSAQDADRATEALEKSLPRGTRGEIQIKERIKADRPEDKPYAHPQYWSAFILIGDPE